MERHTIGEFNIGTHLPGAVTFTCGLTIFDGHAAGIGHVTQAVNPALDLTTYLSGTVTNIVWNADDTQIITLTGHAYRLPMPPNPVTVECTIMLDSKNPASNQASLSYLDGHKWTKQDKLPVQVRWHHSQD